MTESPARFGAAASRMAAAALCSGLLCGGCGEPPADPLNAVRPTAPAAAKNVLLISLDGLRQDHLSLFGYERETSPTIDELGRRGIALRTIVTTSGSTKASLTSLFTGMDYRYHHVFDHRQRLADDYVTLAEAFRDAGYVTVGVTATPMLSRELNYDQGFLIYEDFARRPGASDYVRASQVADRILEFLTRAERQAVGAPFFVYAHFEEPHPPWHPPSPWLADPAEGQDYETQPFDLGCTYVPEPAEFRAVTPEQRAEWIAKYDGAILQADRELGRIVDHLRRSGQLERTIVAVTTDHGYDLMDKYAFGHGFGVSEEIIRAFLVLFDGSGAAWPPAPDVQGRIFDVGPTLLARAGVAVPQTFEGVDLLHQAQRLPRFAFSVDNGVTAVRSADYKLVHVDFAGQRPRPDYLPAFGYMLFDLRADPGETTDLKQLQPERFRELLDEYRRFQRDREAEFVLGTTTPLESQTEERLRSLGYIN